MATRQPPMINAPVPLAVFAALLVAAHIVRRLLPEGVQGFLFFHGALAPERFWLAAGETALSGLPAYANPVAAILPMLTSAFLHGDWVHAVFNAAFLLAVGKPLLELFRGTWPGREPGASLMVLALFVVSQMAGSAAYLLLNQPAGLPAIGASGAVSGFIAAILLIRGGPDRFLLTQGFLVASALFFIANALFAFIGPALIGSGIAWQAHVGGYLGGAAFMRLVLWRLEAGRA
jgi:membrane associated rhomboid family serine protease